MAETNTAFTTTHGRSMNNKRKKAAIGLDIGGTKIAGGVVEWPSGKILARKTVPTLPKRGGAAILNDVVALAAELERQARAKGVRVAGIGAGVAELVDCEGNIRSAQTIQWVGMPVRQRLSGVAKARVESDVRAAATAEATMGAGRGKKVFVYVTVGTGISYCLVQEGRPFRGARGNAIVFASSPLTTDCDQCGARLRPVLEEKASGPAIARAYAEAKGKGESGEGMAGGRSAEEVFEAAKRGDEMAKKILVSAGEALGVQVAFLVNVLDPESIVVGGGLGLAGGDYWKAFVKSCREHIYAKNARAVAIVRAKFGRDAGMIGAAATVFQK
jgi:glucokinase